MSITPDPAEISPDALAAPQFDVLARPLIEHAIALARRLTDSPRDEATEVLHQLRVALRQLRSLLWAYRPLMDQRLNRDLDAVLRYLAHVAGSSRDWDVLVEVLAARHQLGDELAARIAQASEAAFEQSRSTLLHADTEQVLRRSLDEANQSLIDAAEREPAPMLRDWARKRIKTAGRKLQRYMKHTHRARKSDYAAWHAVRKAGKKMRYLLELFEPAWARDQANRGKSFKRRLKRNMKQLKHLQQRFGSLNDVVASESLLRERQSEWGESAPLTAAIEALANDRKRLQKAATRLIG